MASTAKALGPALAVMVVPSSGSRAMSIFGPSPWDEPTLSPMNSIGASSRSPSAQQSGPALWRLFQSGANPLDGGGVGGVIVAPSDPFRRGDGCRLCYPHHFQDQDPI